MENIPLVSHQEDAFWNAAYVAVKSDPDSLDLWERLIEHTERIQNTASQLILQQPSSSFSHSSHDQSKSKSKKHIIPTITSLLPQQYLTIQDTTRKVYDSFLERFPLLFGYWSKYAECEITFAKELKELQSKISNNQNNNTSSSTVSDSSNEIKIDENAEWWHPVLNVPTSALQVHERAVTAFPMSIDLWTSYTDFLVDGLTSRRSRGQGGKNTDGSKQKQDHDGGKVKEEPETAEMDQEHLGLVREVFERAANAVGRDFFSDPFWDKYLEFETNSGLETASKSSKEQTSRNRIVHVLSRIVRIPLHQYARYYDQFTTEAPDLFRASHTSRQIDNGKNDSSTEIQLKDIEVEDTVANIILRPHELDLLKLRQQHHQLEDQDEKAKPKAKPKSKAKSKTKQKQHPETTVSAQLIMDYFDKIIFIRTQSGTTDRWEYESLITRPYFHVLELEKDQMDNWNAYLSWEESERQRVVSLYEKQQDQSQEQQETNENNIWNPDDFIDKSLIRDSFDQVRILYERALIPCALYDTMWLRYARWLYAQAVHIASTSSSDSEDTKNSNVLYNQLLEDTRNVYRRAACLYIPIARPFLRFQYAMFEESLGEVDRARDILQSLQSASCTVFATLATGTLPSDSSTSTSDKIKEEKTTNDNSGSDVSKTKKKNSNNSKEDDELNSSQGNIVSTGVKIGLEDSGPLVDVKWRDILAAAAQTVAGTEAAKAAIKQEQEKLKQQKLQKQQQKQQDQKQQQSQTTSTSQNQTVPFSIPSLPPVLSNMLDTVDDTEPFFYRIELERRVSGIPGALRYIAHILSDSKDKEVEELLSLVSPELNAHASIAPKHTTRGKRGSTATGSKKSGTGGTEVATDSISPFSHSQKLPLEGITPRIRAFLIATRAELLTQLAKLAFFSSSLESIPSKVTFVANTIWLARRFYLEYVPTAIDLIGGSEKSSSTTPVDGESSSINKTGNSKTSGNNQKTNSGTDSNGGWSSTSSASPHFWVSYFEFEVGVIRQVSRMNNEILILFDEEMKRLSNEHEKRLNQNNGEKEGGDSVSSAKVGTKRKKSEVGSSTDSLTVATTNSSTDINEILIRYVQNYLDKLVDLLLTKVGISPISITDMVRTYVDDILMRLLGKRNTSAGSDFSLASDVSSTTEEGHKDKKQKQDTILSDAQPHPPASTDISSTTRQLLLKLLPQTSPTKTYDNDYHHSSLFFVPSLGSVDSSHSSLTVPKSAAVVTTTTSQLLWPVHRATELEIELTGPLAIRSRLLSKLSENGDPETTRRRLRGENTGISDYQSSSVIVGNTNGAS